MIENVIAVEGNMPSVQRCVLYVSGCVGVYSTRLLATESNWMAASVNECSVARSSEIRIKRVSYI